MNKETRDALMAQIKFQASREFDSTALAALVHAYIALVDSENPRRFGYPTGLDSGASAYVLKDGAP